MHEMFFGFGWAVLGISADLNQNWVNVRGYHGAALHFSHRLVD